jgi:hypothetical protein
MIVNMKALNKFLTAYEPFFRTSIWAILFGILVASFAIWPDVLREIAQEVEYSSLLGIEQKLRTSGEGLANIYTIAFYEYCGLAYLRCLNQYFPLVVASSLFLGLISQSRFLCTDEPQQSS